MLAWKWMRFWCCKFCVIETHEKDTHYSRPAVNTTYTDAGSADIAGANICHPCALDIRIPAADGVE
jgi:hypothetical protein